ncbi:unnamed protein product, partial [Prorocentrum cordatum]
GGRRPREQGGPRWACGALPAVRDDRVCGRLLRARAHPRAAEAAGYAAPAGPRAPNGGVALAGVRLRGGRAAVRGAVGHGRQHRRHPRRERRQPRDCLVHPPRSARRGGHRGAPRVLAQSGAGQCRPAHPRLSRPARPARGRSGRRGGGPGAEGLLPRA